MRVEKSVAGVRDALAEIGAGKKVGFVPTMGALHKGHLSLVERCKSECDFCVVSIYVNPAQFGPQEDLSRYPRNLERDLELLEQHQADLVFFPDDSQMYPTGYRTWVEVAELSNVLCGASRPGHFRGVATVVLKLTNIVKPNMIYMGLKDFQQVVILDRMLEDFNCETRIVRCPIVREEDGLALSSRNIYLSRDERLRATSLSQSLKHAQKMVVGGSTDCLEIIAAAEGIISKAGSRIDYIKIVDGQSLAELETVSSNARMLLAVYFGKTRLIDNAALNT
jgi:pantoate--beta-alanine ligase